jgi:hypothetical protein
VTGVRADALARLAVPDCGVVVLSAREEPVPLVVVLYKGQRPATPVIRTTVSWVIPEVGCAASAHGCKSVAVQLASVEKSIRLNQAKLKRGPHSQHTAHPIKTALCAICCALQCPTQHHRQVDQALFGLERTGDELFAATSASARSVSPRP